LYRTQRKFINTNSQLPYWSQLGNQFLTVIWTFYKRPFHIFSTQLTPPTV